MSAIYRKKGALEPKEGEGALEPKEGGRPGGSREGGRPEGSIRIKGGREH